MYSSMFEEVIFVLKKGCPEIDSKNVSIVSEAKMVIEDYINKAGSYTMPQQTKQVTYELNGYEKGKKLNIILNICLVLSIVLLGLMLIRIF
jgi:hypothetical protein